MFTRTAKSSTLVTLHDGGGLRSFVVVPEGHDADQAALHLAQAVAARAEPVEMPALGGAAVGWLVARPSSTAVRDPQAGADPAEVARRLAVAMRPGSWLAVLVRESGRSEVRWSRRWYEARLGTTMPVHHSTGKSVTVSFLAGGDSAFDVRSMLDQVAGSLPGFDVEVVSRVGSMRRTVAPWLVASAVAWVGVVVGVGWSALAGAAAALAPALVGLFVSAGRAGSMVGRVRRFAERGEVMRPARRILPAKRPHPGSGSGWLDRLGGGDYPLASTSFLVGPQVVVGVVAPHAGASSGAALTERRAAPSALLDRIGPALGVAGEAAAMVHLPAESAWGGVGLAGTPGSGKSSALRSIWGWNCVERVAPSGAPGFPGARNALVAFESKPDGAAWYRRWSEGVGDDVAVIEVGDPSTWSIDLLGVPGTVEERARFFVNAMVYAFNDGAIQDRSFETLTAVLTAALCVTPAIAAAAGVSPEGSPLFFAHVLLGGLGDPMAVALAESLASEAARSEREAGSRSLPAAGGPQGPFVPLTEIGLADQKLLPMFGGRSTEATRRSLCEAPRNKLGQLLGAESWWSPARVKVTWDQVLEHHLAVVVNTGVSTSGAVVDERLSGQMSALLMYGLRDAIQRRCSGWQEEGRSVSIFADELALLVGSSADVVTWLRNQGRSYGVRATFATQYPEQLPRPVRTVFMSFDTFVWFAQTNAEVVAEAAADLSLDGSDWTAADLAGLEPFTAVVRTRLGGQRLPAVPVKVAFWEGDIASYRADVVS